jgi:diacylglycerol O-acyltransferase-1
MYFIIEQYVLPTLRNSLKPFNTLNPIGLLERMLKLSIPTVYVWLLMFYSCFHSLLNLVSELLYFGDRDFYRPWWNANTIAEYWRLWNLPVYKWFKRHVYIPCVKSGIPAWVASGIAFFISAVAHEIIFGVPTHLLKGYSFAMMMLQLPAIYVSGKFYMFVLKFKGKQNVHSDGSLDSVTSVTSLGNYLFWFWYDYLK